MSNNPRRFWFAAVCLTVLAGSAASARAETLADALALAYQSNPALQSQRALQRQLDETYVQAHAGFRPTVNLNGTINYSYAQLPGAGVGATSVERKTLGSTLQASQPIYTGGRASGALDVAEANVLAGRAVLRATEQTVLQQAIQAFQDVLRDQQIVAIRRQSVEVLSSQLNETRARFEVGLLTRTDVARSEAQVAGARAALATAQAALQNSRAGYTAVVGQNPGELAVPATLPGLPASVDEAFRASEEANPTLQRAQIAEQASRYRVAQVRALKNPTLSMTGSVGYNGFYDPLGSFQRNLAVGGQFSQPLFAGGAINSQIRGALEQNTSDRILIEQARRTTIQSVAQAWNQMQAALAGVTSNREQVRAATVAFEGTQEQFRVGISTTLDVLLTQETLRAAQLALVQAERDVYVAQANLLSAMGRLDARNLVQGVDLYDPAANFDKVKDNGAVPWEKAIVALDQIGRHDAPDPARPIPAPASAAGPVTMNPTGVTPSTDAGFSTASPTQASMGTVPGTSGR